MTAVDTNVLIRLMVAGDRKQAATAQALFAREPIWIAKTVLLEAAWVLRSFYGFEAAAIREAFTRLLGLSNVQVEDAPAVAAALAMSVHGVELPDALHLSSRPSDAAFVSLDRAFVRRAKRAGASQISSL